MNPNQQNPYDYLDYSKSQNTQTYGASTSKRTRIIQVAVIAVVILIFGIIAMNLLTAGGKSATEKLIKVAAAQEDLIAISTLGTAKARASENVTRSATAKSVVTTQNSELVTYLSKNGVKNATKQIAAQRDVTYEKTLDEALKNGNYDEAYKAVFSNRLDLYRSTLQTAYDGVDGPTIKKLLESHYSQLNLITPEQK